MILFSHAKRSCEIYENVHHTNISCYIYVTTGFELTVNGEYNWLFNLCVATKAIIKKKFFFHKPNIHLHPMFILHIYQGVPGYPGFAGSPGIKGHKGDIGEQGIQGRTGRDGHDVSNTTEYY